MKLTRILMVVYILLSSSVMVGVLGGLGGISNELVGGYKYILSTGVEGAKSIVSGVGGTYDYIPESTIRKIEEAQMDYTKVSIEGVYNGVIVRGVEGSGGLPIKSGKQLEKEGEVLIGEELSKKEKKEEGEKLEIQGESYEIVGIVEGGGLGVWKMGVEGKVLGVLFNEMKEGVMEKGLYTYSVDTIKENIRRIREGEWIEKVEKAMLIWVILTQVYLILTGLRVVEIVIGLLGAEVLIRLIEAKILEYVQSYSVAYEGSLLLILIIPMLLIAVISKRRLKSNE